MACWGRSDITKEKEVFVWPSAAGRANKSGMKSLKFRPGMTEKEVKAMWIKELELDCELQDIKGLVDGYGTFCDKLSDITLNRKGYHVCYHDERQMELAMLRKENQQLKGRLADGAGGGESEENTRLQQENKALKEEIAALKAQLAQLRPPTKGTPDSSPAGGSKAVRRGSRDFESARREVLKSMPLPKFEDFRKPSKATPAKRPARPRSGLVQAMDLPVPHGAADGHHNYNTLREAWLAGARTDSGAPLEPPEDVEYGVDDLLLAERPKPIKNPIPLQSLITALAGQWKSENTL